MYDIRPNKSRVYFLAHATVKTLSSFSNYLTAQYIKVNYNFCVDEILYYMYQFDSIKGFQKPLGRFSFQIGGGSCE